MIGKSIGSFICFLFCLFAITSCDKCEHINSNDIRAIYVGNMHSVKKIKNILRAYDANAVIFDIKNDYGELTCDLHIDNAILANNHISNIRDFIKELKKDGIYTIGRIVTFKDSKREDLSIKTSTGDVWVDKEKTKWLNPYNKDVWKYVVDISKEAIKAGFDEIQFDYVRFSSYACNDIDWIAISGGLSREEIITEFLEYACSEIHKLNGKVSIDVFGCIVDGATDDSGQKNAEILGQNYIKIAQIADYVCPMIYPSHFPKKAMGIEFPDLKPYDVIYKFLILSNKMLESSTKKRAIVRPYLQAFTAKWVKPHQVYAKEQIKEQINATYDAGLSQWSLFHFAVKYPIK